MMDVVEDLPGHRTEVDPPRAVVMLRLVRPRRVDPWFPGHVHVDRPHDDDLARAHPRQALEVYHRPHRPGDMGQDRVDEGIEERPDRRRFAGFTSPPLSPTTGFNP